MSLDQQSEVSYSFFTVSPSGGPANYNEAKVMTTRIYFI